MWIFAEYGYLLPTITEETDPMRRHADWDHYSENGRFTFQVRARLREHLEYYLEYFGEEGTYGPIWATPDHDYNFRVFTTQEAFAAAMYRSILAIDYRNFKDQSYNFPRGREYHDLLIDIWADSAKLGDGPGGFYGPWSPENPHGYKKAKKYHAYGTGEFSGRRIGDSFQNIVFDDEEYPTVDDDLDGFWEGGEWIDSEAQSIVAELDRYGIAMEDWPLNLVPSEFETVLPVLRQSYGKKKVKRMVRENKIAFGG